MSQPERVPERYYPRVYMEFELSAALTHALQPLFDRGYSKLQSKPAAYSPIFTPEHGIDPDQDLQTAIYENIQGDFRRLGARIGVNEIGASLILPEAHDIEAAFCKHALVGIGIEKRRQEQFRKIISQEDPMRANSVQPAWLTVGIPYTRLHKDLTNRDKYVARIGDINRKVKGEARRRESTSPYYVYGHPRVRLAARPS